MDAHFLASANQNKVWFTFHLKALAWVCAAFALFICPAGAQTNQLLVTTMAGLANFGTADGSGAVAKFLSPTGVAVDANGNIYVADTENDTIRKVTPTGVVSTLAGLAQTPGTNDGTGSVARFNQPYGVAVDSFGNVFVADTYNSTIREITPGGVVTTFAGIPGVGPQYRDGSVTNQGTNYAMFGYPYGIAIDSSNNIYVADTYTHLIRVITNGQVATLAGDNNIADIAATNNFGNADGIGAAARFDYPFALATDRAGNVYVADTGNNLVRQVTPAGVVRTIAGTNGNGTFSEPLGIAVDAGTNIYVADSQDQVVQLLVPSGTNWVVSPYSPLAGQTNRPGDQDGADRTSPVDSFYQPWGLAVDSVSNVYVGDSLNGTLRKITPLTANPYSTLSTLAGPDESYGLEDGTNSAARFYEPESVAVDGAGNVYVADTFNNCIRLVTPAGVVTTLAGSVDGYSGSDDGANTGASFDNPTGICLDANTNIYVADSENSSVRLITPDVAHSNWFTTTISTNFMTPVAVAVDSSTNVYVTDSGSKTVEIISGGTVSNFASTNIGLVSPTGIAVDGATNVYVADDTNNVIYVIAPDGTVSNITSKLLNSPQGIALDSYTNIYVANGGADTILEISNGVVFSIAGATNFIDSSDGLDSDGRFDFPAGVAVDTNGNVYVADANNNTIRMGAPFNPAVTAALTLSCSPSGLPVAVNGTNYGTPQILSYLLGSTLTNSAPLTNMCFVTNIATNADLPAVSTNFYLFTNWTLDGSGAGSTTNLSLDLNGNETLVANYLPLYSYSSCAMPTNGGAVTGSGTNLLVGTSNTVTASAVSNYVFADWTVNNEIVSSSSNYTFALNGNEALVANFIETFTISATPLPADGGSVTVEGTNLIGSIDTVTATPDTNFVFTNWTQGGVIVSTNTNYAFTLTSNVTLVANFIPIYSVSVSASPTNGGAAGGSGTFPSNSVRTVTATTYNGYNFTNWTFGSSNGPLASTNSIYTFTVVSNVSLVANFAPPNYILTLSTFPTNNADGTVAGSGTYPSNSIVIATATPISSNYAFVGWFNTSGGLVNSSNPYSFPLNTNQALVGHFGQIDILTLSNFPSNGGSNIVSSVGTNGIAISGTTISVVNGSTVTNTAFPNANFAFTNWTEGGVVQSTANPYSFNLVNSNLTLVANYIPKYAVTLIAAPAGGGTLNGAGTFPSNSSRTVTATANPGYAFTNWTRTTANGTVESANANYTFTVTNNVTNVANFLLTPQQIAIFGGTNAVANNQTTPLNFGDVQVGQTGSNVTFTVTNLGGQPLTVSNITVPPGYTLITNSPETLTNLPAVIPGVSNATFEVVLDTTAVGTFAGNIVISNNDPANGIFTIPITASVASDAPQITVWNGNSALSNGQTSPVAIGSAQVGQAGPTVTFTVLDTGVDLLVVSNITVPTGFVLTSNFAATTIPASNSIPFTVQLQTSAAGTVSGNVIITDNDPSNNPFVFSISGTVTNGAALPAKVISLGGDLVFGVASIGSSMTNTLTISNAGNASLTVSAINYPHGVFTGAWSGPIAAGATQSVPVIFSPVAAADYSGAVTVSSDATAGTNTAPITAFGANTNLVLTILTNGAGTVTPNDAKLLKQSQLITLKAVPASADVFAGWTGSYTSTGNPLVFTMQKSTIVEANFIPNPFTPYAATYNGLFTNENGIVTESTAGMLKALTVTSKGTYTGTLLFNGASKSISGTFNSSLQVRQSISVSATAGTVELALTLVSNGAVREVIGTVSNANWVANLVAEQAASPSLLPAYTMLILPDTNLSDSGGYGYASITGVAGTSKTPATVKIAGYLADGTAFSQSAPISSDSDVPVYASLYSNKGLLLGLLNLTNASTGTLTWAYPSHTLFPNPANSTNEVLLSPWTSVSAAASLPTNLLDLETTGETVVITNFPVTISGTSLKSSAADVSGTITAKTGVLTVTIGTGASKVTAHGVLLLNATNGTNGGGYFTTKTSTGSILLAP